jgi:septin family protein
MLKTNARSGLQWKMMMAGENGPGNSELITDVEEENKLQGGCGRSEMVETECSAAIG